MIIRTILPIRDLAKKWWIFVFERNVYFQPWANIVHDSSGIFKLPIWLGF